ncbi:MAG: SOS response-associated peptidase [Chloroflexia bacterium]
MCGRYEMVAGSEQLTARFDLAFAPAAMPPRSNIAPGQDNPVIVVQSPRRLVAMRWGLVPAWAPDPDAGIRPINARVETVATKPAFRAAFRSTRCLVPATGYYEWPPAVPGARKQPVRLSLAEGHNGERPLFAFAGLYSSWCGPDGRILDTYTILTTSALPTLAALHERMPVILATDAEAAWLDPTFTDPAGLLALLNAGSPPALTVMPIATLLPDLLPDIGC